jgi:hypothetical protein
MVLILIHLGNFNTGSTEFDGDVTNSPSEVPWFMNAKNDTYHNLVDSPTVGGGSSTVTKLRQYTGDITASAVPIGPAFNLYSPPSPIEIFPPLTQIQGTPGYITTQCPLGLNNPILINANASERIRSMTVEVFGNSNTQWVWWIEYNDSGNWEIGTPDWLDIISSSPEPNPYSSPNGGFGNINSGPLEVRAAEAVAPVPLPNPVEYATRQFRILVQNYTYPGNIQYCGNYTQIIYAGGGGPSDPQE